MANPLGDNDQSQQVQPGRDAYVAGRDLYLTNNRVLSDELDKFRSFNAQKRAEMLIAYAAEDKTLRDATVVLRRAPLDAATGSLRELLSCTGPDKDLALTLLDFIEERRKQELLDRLTPEFPVLESFAEAMKAISGIARRTREIGKSDSRVSPAWGSPSGTRGFCSDYSNGRIYWSGRGGPHACYGEINKYFDNHRGSGGVLGFPLSADDQAEPWTGGGVITEGRYQRFEGPSDYSDDVCARLNGGLTCGATVYWADGLGTHATYGPIGEFCEKLEGTAGWLGFPVEDEVTVRSKSGELGLRQRFQGGVIYHRGKTGAIAVPYPIAACHNWDQRADDMRFPESSSERVGPASHSRTEGYRQHFERRVTVYNSEHGTYIVGWGIRSCYDQFGGPGSWLGFPLSEEISCSFSAEGPRATIQAFEGGKIFYREERVRKAFTIPVPSVVLDAIAEIGGLAELMGFPVEPVHSLGSGRDDLIYFFDHGLVTVRDGGAVPWLPARFRSAD